MLIGSRSKLCNLIIQQSLLVEYIININIDNSDYIQYNMWQSRRTVTDFELCSCYIIIITLCEFVWERVITMGLVQRLKTTEQLKRGKQL